jgi:hypothetical protein
MKNTYENERNQGNDAATFTHSSHADGTDGGQEDQLKFAEEYRRNGPDRLCENTSMECIAEVAKDSSRTISVRERISDYEPLD